MSSEATVPKTYFWRQDTVHQILARAAEQRRLPRTALLIGPEGVGKWAAAQWMAKSLLCTGDGRAGPCDACDACARADKGTHPDWHALFPVPSKTAEEDTAAFLEAKREDYFRVVRFKSRAYVTIDRVRDLQAELAKSPVEGGAKVAIIVSADTMTAETQTVLLKSIEEPPPNTCFILTTADPGRIFPTVYSRCRVIRLAPVAPEHIAERLREERSVDPADASLIARLSGGGWGEALRLDSEEIRESWKSASDFWDLAFSQGPATIIGEIDRRFRKPDFGDVLLAFDVWGLRLWRDTCRIVLPHPESTREGGAPLPDTEAAWACWKILQAGRASLRVNVRPRHAVWGTFIALKRRLQKPKRAISTLT